MFTSIIFAYITTLISLVVIDSIWLHAMVGFYRSRLGHIFAESFSVFPAAIFYIAYSAAILYFVVYSSTGGSLLKVFLVGVCFGAIAYATYDLTNQATLKDWPVIVTIVDIVWGALLTGIVSGIVFLAFR